MKTFFNVGWAEFTKRNTTILSRLPLRQPLSAARQWLGWQMKTFFNVGWAEFTKPNISISPIATITRSNQTHAHLKLRFDLQDGRVGLRKLSPTYGAHES